MDGRTEHKRLRYLKKELEWIKRSPKARTTKSQSRINRYHETASQTGPEKELDIDLIIPPAKRLGNKVVELENVNLSFGNKP